MASGEPPAPYSVEYSGLVPQRLRELATEASARGDGPAFAAALKEFDRLLRFYPQFGDPLIDLAVGGGQVRLGIVRPLSMRYGVNEDMRIVFCAPHRSYCRWAARRRKGTSPTKLPEIEPRALPLALPESRPLIRTALDGSIKVRMRGH
jgi:hypothetical protein